MFSRSQKRFFIFAITVVFGLCVALFSVIPINRLSLGTRTISMSPNDIQKAQHLHVAAHLVIFGVLAAMGWFATATKTTRSIALALTLLLGFGTEYMQHHVYRGPIVLIDVYTNVFASLAVFTAMTIFFGVRSILRKSRR